jgi:hypothetical protein
MDYYLRSKQILRDEMRRRGISVEELVVRLTEIGSPEMPRSLTVKISRGRFQLAFFLQCMTAMGVEAVWLPCPSRLEAKLGDPPEITRNRPTVFGGPNPEKSIYTGRQHKPADGVVRAGAKKPKTQQEIKQSTRRKAA